MMQEYRITKLNDPGGKTPAEETTITVKTDNIKQAVDEFVDKNTFNVKVTITREYADE